MTFLEKINHWKLLEKFSFNQYKTYVYNPPTAHFHVWRIHFCC